MTRFPDLLLLTFLPILLRLFINLGGWITQTDHTHRNKARTSMNRLVLYAFIMLFRIFFLYIYLNLVQEFMQDSSTKRLSPEMPETPTHLTNTDCWYANFTTRNTKNPCYRQQFDFSDHTVLFFAQSLPIMLLETTVFHFFPLWPTHTTDHTSDNGIPTPRRTGAATSGRADSIPSFIFNTLLSSCLSSFFFYINNVTLLVAHSTAAYFHTTKEVVVGYIISLVVQIPITILISSSRHSGIRYSFGLPSAREYRDLSSTATKLSDIDPLTGKEHSD